MKSEKLRRGSSCAALTGGTRSAFGCVGLSASARVASAKRVARKSAKTAIVHCSLLILTCGGAAAAAVPVRWTVEVGRVSPVVFEAYHGETLALEASFKDGSKALEMPSDGCCLMWQTNGMGSAWWQAPAAVSTNRVTATFTPAMDPGAAAVTGFLGATGQNYRAAFTLRFRHGPGAAPNALEPPVRTLDFATVAVANAADAPFALKGQGGGGCDTNAVSAIVTNHVASGYLCTVGTAGTLVTNATDALRADVASAAITNAGAVAAATASAAAALAQAVGTVGTLVTNATDALRADVASAAITNAGAVAAAAAYAAQVVGTAGTNVASATITNHVKSGYLCTVAAAEDAYLKKLETAAFADGAKRLASFRRGFTSPATIGFETDGLAAYVQSEQDAFFRTYKSALKPDGSPFATSNMVERMIAAAGGGGGCDTNAVSAIITNHVASGYLCTVGTVGTLVTNATDALRDDVASAAITNAGAVAAAAASAAATYLPLAGGMLMDDVNICGNLYFNDSDNCIAFENGRLTIGEDGENISFCRVEIIDNGWNEDPTYVDHESRLMPDGSNVATSNMVERMADYALTGGAVLKSGEIAAFETATNLTLTLDFAANGRGADCGAYVENTAASNVTLAVAGGFHVACAGDEPLTLPKASTNIVYFCRVKTNVVVVSRSEIK